MAITSESCFVIGSSRGLEAVYCDKSGVASMRVYGADGWRHNGEIARNVSGRISVNISDKEELFVFFQDKDGNIALKHFDGTNWTSRIIQENPTSALYNIRLCSIVKNGGLHLLYNIPSKISDETRYKIVSHTMADGKWLPSELAAENVAEARPVFSLQNIKGDHYALYYQTGSMENTFGYRELYLPDKWSAFTPLHQSLHSFADKSVVTSADGIHLAFILKGTYSCQLIYKNKLGSEAGPARVLFEASRLDSVSLSLIGGHIHIFFSAGGYGFFSVASNDSGRTFGRPQRHKTAGLGRLIKAEYISSLPQDGQNTVRDLFTDVESPGSAPLLEELYDGFYPSAATLKAAGARTAEHGTAGHGTSDEPRLSAEKPWRPADNAGQRRDGGDNGDLHDLRDMLDEKSRRIAILENKYENSNREISEKNRQILELNSLLSKKNDETASVVNSYRETIQLLRNELSEKTRALEELRTQSAAAPVSQLVYVQKEEAADDENV